MTVRIVSLQGEGIGKQMPAGPARAVSAVLVLAGAAGSRALLALTGLVQRLEPQVYQETGLRHMHAGAGTARAKTVKRAMYGRASFRLLRIRILIRP
ncbi:hypothetical protein [Streptomyces sp. NPDC091278]|uniref:hypothetical protein n=1 Tax=Streptomyces sp. NPDC091278 TaxID=3155301 RepID=UPI00344BD8E4